MSPSALLLRTATPVALLLSFALVPARLARAGDEVAPLPAAGAPAPPAAAPETPSTAKVFEKPGPAVLALVGAFERNDDAALKALLGTDAADLVPDGKDPKVAEERARLARLAREVWSFDRAQESAGVLRVEVGAQHLPLAIPVVRTPEGWRLDAAAGRAELLARRIGRNELEAIALCRQYVEMQVAYAAKDRDGDGVREYAQRVASTPGTRDGLYWESPAGDDAEPSPLGLALSTIGGTGTEEPPAAPYGGYRWSILEAQGGHVPGGAHSYRIRDDMIAGFALVAAPAEYRRTGVMTFLVNQDGVVFQKDLGPTTAEVVKAIDAYDPDDTWTEVGEEPLDVTAVSASDEGGASASAPGGAPVGTAAPTGTAASGQSGRPCPPTADLRPPAPPTADPLGTFEVTYADGQRFTVTVPDRGTVTWQGVAGAAEGTSGTETVDRRELAPNLWYVSWQQKDGTVMTQIVDLGRMTVLSTRARDGTRTVLEGTIRRLP